MGTSVMHHGIPAIKQPEVSIGRQGSNIGNLPEKTDGSRRQQFSDINIIEVKPRMDVTLAG